MSMRIFFIQRGTTINEAIEDMRKQGWHKILPIGESPLPQEGKIKIRVKDVKYHPIKEDGTKAKKNLELLKLLNKLEIRKQEILTFTLTLYQMNDFLIC